MTDRTAGHPEASSPLMVSMVVDWLDAHPYQAEILLLTLEEMAGVPRHRIVLQCTDRVPAEVVTEFRSRGHVVTIITPYLDRAYCNKIAQLDYFLDASVFDSDTEGVLLLDLDVVVLAPLQIANADVVWGKVVDAPSPQLEVVKSIFAKAKVPLPPIVPCDWKRLGQTVSTNLNGGVLYIPRGRISTVRQNWRHWAEWLHAHPTAFRHPIERKHIDQLSFALTLTSCAIPWRHFSSNWNFPGGRNRTPSQLNPSEPVRILHYHSWGLDNLGLVRPVFSATRALNDAVTRVNFIVSKRTMKFFERFRSDRALSAVGELPLLEPNLFTDEFVAREARVAFRRRLVLHGGMPKTGTSSLQWYLSENRPTLAASGFWYPASTYPLEPKHQPLSATLRTGDISGFARYVESALHDMPDNTHTVILSTEGISNHWWDYPPEGRSALRRLAALFDFELCLWFREPVSFAAAFWAQSLINPPTAAKHAMINGCDVSLSEAMENDWFRRHFDYFGLWKEAGLLFGKSRVRALSFQGDTIATFLDEYNIPVLPLVPMRRNVTLGRLGTTLVRLVNRSAFTVDGRRRVLRWISRLDRLVGVLAGKLRVSTQERALIERESGPNWRVMPPVLAASHPRHPRRSKVFCLGLGGRDAESLGIALGILGYRVAEPTEFQGPDIPARALASTLGLASEFDALIGDPASVLFRELDVCFPNSRFVLTKLSAEQWLNSALHHFGSGETSMREWIYGYGSPIGHKDVYRKRYDSHCAEVHSHFAGRSNLLILDVAQGDGWQELCSFLGEAIPTMPFPRAQNPPEGATTQKKQQ